MDLVGGGLLAASSLFTDPEEDIPTPARRLAAVFQPFAGLAVTLEPSEILADGFDVFASRPLRAPVREKCT